MGYWENTTYLRFLDLNQIERELVRTFAAEGFLPVPKPPSRDAAYPDRMQYGDSSENTLWGLALIPGPSDWTIVKTAPLELLGERAPAGKRLRIGDLCAGLGCDGFIYNVYDSTDLILVEANAKGTVRVSGGAERYMEITDDGIKVVPYNGEPFAEDDFGRGFGLIEVSEEISRAYRSFPDNQKLARLLGGEALGDSNEICGRYLIPHEEMQFPGARALYFSTIETDHGLTSCQTP